jgi:hypothetical protein
MHTLFVAPFLMLSTADAAEAPTPPPAAEQVATPDGKPPPPKKKTDKKGKKGKKGKDANVGPFKKAKYPIKEIRRPLVLPDSMGEVGLDATFGSVAGTTYLSAGPAFHYGVADVVDFGLRTDLLLAPNTAWSKSLPIDAHYLAVDTEQFDWAPGLVLPLTFVDGAGFGVVVDLPARYVLNDTVFFTFGQGALPIRFAPDFVLSLAANGGVGFQVDKAVALGLDTNVFTINIAPAFAGTGIWDFLNLGAYGQYSFNRNADLGLRLNVFNAWGVDDTLAVNATLFGAYRF